MSNALERYQAWLIRDEQRIRNEQRSEGLAWLQGEASTLGLNAPVSLGAAERWQNLYKPNTRNVKASYTYYEHHDDKERPRLYIALHSFTSGETTYFDDYEIIERLWSEAKGETFELLDPAVIAAEREARRVERERKEAERKEAEQLETEGYRAESFACYERAATLTSAHPYLERKGLDPSDLPDGIRRGVDTYERDDCLLIPMRTLNGAWLGLQQIDGNGSKLYSKGSVKGAAVVFGDLDSAKTIAIGEGVATSAVIHKASAFDATIAAMSTSGLEVVATQVKEHYPDAELVITGDNDAFTKDNPGIAAAAKAARAVGGRYVVPDFANVDQTSKPTDFDDLAALAGLTTLNKQLSATVTPSPTAALAKERGYAYHRVATRYMGNGGVEIPIDGTFGLGGEQGIGKSVFARNALLEDETVLCVTPYQSLADNAAVALLGDASYSYSVIPHEVRNYATRLSICVDSLPTCARKGKMPTYGTVILDEIEQLLTRLTTQDDISNKPGVLDALRYVVRTARRVIVADADIGALTMDFLSALRGDDITIIEGAYKPVAGREITVVKDDGTLDKMLLERVKAGKRCYVTANSRKRVNKIAARIAKKIPSAKILKVTSQTTGNPDVIRFLRDPSSVALEYDVIIVSPSLNTGVSIVGDIFGFMAGYFVDTVNTPHDCKQALRRVRNECEAAIWVRGSKRRYETDPDKLRQRWIDTPERKRSDKATVTDDGRVVPISEFYEDLWLSANVQRHKRMTGFRNNLISLLKESGYIVNDSDKSAEDAKEESKATAAAGEEERVETLVQAIKEAPSTEDAKRIAAKDRRTSDDNAALEGYAFRRYYRLSEPDMSEDEIRAIVDEDANGSLRRKIDALEIAIEPDDAAQARQQRARKDDTGNDRLRPDIRHVALEREDYRRALKAAHVNPDADELSVSPEPYSSDTAAARDYVAWRIANKHRLAGFAKINDNDSPAKMIGQTLRRLGLKTVRRGDGGKLKQVDPESLATMRRWLEVRAQPWEGYQPNETSKIMDTLLVTNTKKQGCPLPPPSTGTSANTIINLAKRAVKELESIARDGWLGSPPARYQFERIAKALDVGEQLDTFLALTMHDDVRARLVAL